DLALAELIQRGGARRLIHVAMQGADTEAVLQQRLVQQRHFALAVTKDDRVFEILCLAQQAAQRIALLVRLAANAELKLRYALGCGGGPGNFSSARSEEHTSELQSQSNLVCRLLLEKKKKKKMKKEKTK